MKPSKVIYYQEGSTTTPSNNWSKIIPISTDVNEYLSMAALRNSAEKPIRNKVKSISVKIWLLSLLKTDNQQYWHPTFALAERSYMLPVCVKKCECFLFYTLNWKVWYQHKVIQIYLIYLICYQTNQQYSKTHWNFAYQSILLSHSALMFEIRIFSVKEISFWGRGRGREFEDQNRSILN